MAGEYGNDFITLVDEDGEEQEFEVIDSLEYNDTVYYALAPVSASGETQTDESDVVILKLMPDENGEDELVTIEDDDELDTVFNLFVDAQEDEMFDELDGEAEESEDDKPLS